MFSKKGQSALEYLMTYGWALIVIVIVIGALMLLVGNPTQASKGCSQGGKFIYVEGAYDPSTTTYSVVLTNGSGKNVTLGTDAQVIIDDANATATGGPIWNAGTNKTFTNSSASPTANQLTMDVMYTVAGMRQDENKLCNV